MHKMEQADIIVFLFSPDFIASEECTNEWNHALNLASSGKPLFRIPIIDSLVKTRFEEVPAILHI